MPPSISRGIPIPNERLYDLLAGQQSSIQEGGGKEWRVFDVKSKKVVAGPFPTKAIAENSEKFKEGGEGRPRAGRAEEPHRHHLHLGVGGDLPARGEHAGAGRHLLLPLQVPAGELRAADPGDEGRRPEALGHAQDFDTTTGEPIVLMQFTKDGTDKFGDITRELAQRGKRVSFGGQDQFQHFAIVLDDEIRSLPSIDFNENPNGISGSNGAQITGMAGAERGEGPRDRAPDRCAAGRVPDARGDADLGDARQGLAPAGLAGGDRRPHARRALPARLLPLPRPDRGARPRRSTRRCCTARSCSST